jgi:hypothetical protein
MGISILIDASVWFFPAHLRRGFVAVESVAATARSSAGHPISGYSSVDGPDAARQCAEAQFNICACRRMRHPVQRPVIDYLPAVTAAIMAAVAFLPGSGCACIGAMIIGGRSHDVHNDCTRRRQGVEDPGPDVSFLTTPSADRIALRSRWPIFHSKPASHAVLECMQ